MKTPHTTSSLQTTGTKRRHIQTLPSHSAPTPSAPSPTSSSTPSPSSLSSHSDPLCPPSCTTTHLKQQVHSLRLCVVRHVVGHNLRNQRQQLIHSCTRILTQLSHGSGSSSNSVSISSKNSQLNCPQNPKAVSCQEKQS